MAIGAPEGDHRGDGIAAPPGPAGTLLVAGPRRRHVTEGDTRQGANVDANLHGGGARQDVNRRLGGRPRRWDAQIDILEEKFVLLGLREHIVRLRSAKLRSVFSCDDRHWSFGRVTESPDRATPVVTLTRCEYGVSIGIDDFDAVPSAVRAPTDARERPLRGAARLAVTPPISSIEGQLVGQDAVLTGCYRLAKHIEQLGQPALVEDLLSFLVGHTTVDGGEAARVRLHAPGRLQPARVHVLEPNAGVGIPPLGNPQAGQC